MKKKTIRSQMNAKYHSGKVYGYFHIFNCLALCILQPNHDTHLAYSLMKANLRFHIDWKLQLAFHSVGVIALSKGIGYR